MVEPLGKHLAPDLRIAAGLRKGYDTAMGSTSPLSFFCREASKDTIMGFGADESGRTTRVISSVDSADALSVVKAKSSRWSLVDHISVFFSAEDMAFYYLVSLCEASERLCNEKKGPKKTNQVVLDPPRNVYGGGAFWVFGWCERPKTTQRLTTMTTIRNSVILRQRFFTHTDLKGLLFNENIDVYEITQWKLRTSRVSKVTTKE
eukprot:scaffold4683_cov112-Cylindrotheca_fusiformis.AAC.7